MHTRTVQKPLTVDEFDPVISEFFMLNTVESSIIQVSFPLHVSDLISTYYFDLSSTDQNTRLTFAPYRVCCCELRLSLNILRKFGFLGVLLLG